MRELRLFSLERRCLRGGLIVVYEYLRGGVMTREPGLSQWCPVTGQMAKAKEEIREFWLNIRNTNFAVRVTEHCNRLLLPALKILIIQLDMLLTCSSPVLGHSGTKERAGLQALQQPPPTSTPAFR